MTLLLLKKGEKVAATLRKPEVLADLSLEYPPDQLLVLKLDVTKPQEILDAFAEAGKHFGRIDVVFNNAGYGVVGEVEATPEVAARALFDVNFWGAVNVSREAVRFFREVNNPPGGRLLQNSSMLGLIGGLCTGFYVATKYALEGLSETLAGELDPEWNIRIVIIEPGWFRTNVTGEKLVSVPVHPAYDKPHLPTAIVHNHLASRPLVRGDTAKAVEVIYRIGNMPEPPLRFPLGKDCVATVRSQTAALIAITDKYESWSEGLDAE